MTNPNQQSAADESPEGLIFLPDSVKGLRNYQLGLMLGRIARGSTLDEIEALHGAAEEKIQRMQALLTYAGHIAVATGE